MEGGAENAGKHVVGGKKPKAPFNSSLTYLCPACNERLLRVLEQESLESILIWMTYFFS